MIAVIMAGGKSSRMGGMIEKPLVRIGRQTLLERTVEAIEGSRAGDIVVATSPTTPKTAKFAIRKGLAVMETPGGDYHDDVYFLLDKFGSYLSVNVDIPFLSSEAINSLLSNAKKVSIACVLPFGSISYPVPGESVGKGKDGKEYVWIGLNYVTSSPDTELLVMEDELLAVNINTPYDLAMASRMLAEQKRGKR